MVWPAICSNQFTMVKGHGVLADIGCCRYSVRGSDIKNVSASDTRSLHIKASERAFNFHMQTFPFPTPKPQFADLIQNTDLTSRFQWCSSCFGEIWLLSDAMELDGISILVLQAALKCISQKSWPSCKKTLFWTVSWRCWMTLVQMEILELQSG